MTTITPQTRILPNSITNRYERLAWIFHVVAQGNNQHLYLHPNSGDLAFAPDPAALEGEWERVRFPATIAGAEAVRGDTVMYWDYIASDDGHASFGPHWSQVDYRSYLLYTPGSGWSWESEGDTSERRFTDDPRRLAGLIESMEDEFFASV